MSGKVVLSSFSKKYVVGIHFSCATQLQSKKPSYEMCTEKVQCGVESNVTKSEKIGMKNMTNSNVIEFNFNILQERFARCNYSTCEDK